MLPFGISSIGSGQPRILCIGAHSDDIEIGCGGSILHLLKARPDAKVMWVVFSSGSLREQEAKASAFEFLKNASSTVILIEDFQSSFFPNQWFDIKKYFEAELKSFDPDLIFTHYREDRHQDHRVLSDLTWNTFRRHLILEYEIPKYDGDLGQPNHYVSITDEYADIKINALVEIFQTQRDRHWFTEDLFRGFMRVRGMEVSSHYAEAFYVRKAKLGF